VIFFFFLNFFTALVSGLLVSVKLLGMYSRFIALFTNIQHSLRYLYDYYSSRAACLRAYPNGCSCAAGGCAEKLLASEITKYEKSLCKQSFAKSLNANQFAALVSFSYNLGTGILSDGKWTITK